MQAITSRTEGESLSSDYQTDDVQQGPGLVVQTHHTQGETKANRGDRMISFTVPGDPIAQPRHKVLSQSGFAV